MYKKIFMGILVLGILGIAVYGICSPAPRPKKIATSTTGVVTTTAPTTTAPIHMVSGWNLVSMPCIYSPFGINSDAEFWSLFPTASTYAFGVFYNRTTDDEWCNYLACDTCRPRAGGGYDLSWPDPGEGFWIKYPSAQDVNIPCQSLNTYMEIPVWTGVSPEDGHEYPAWNLVGGISYDVPIGNVTTNVADALDSRFFAYVDGQGYVSVDSDNPLNNAIKAGSGYWIKVKKCGRIILQQPGLSKTKIGFAIMGVTGVNTSGLNVLQISIPNNTRKLKFGIPIMPIAENMTTIPSAMTGDFDVRFTDGGGKNIEPFATIPSGGLYYDISVTDWVAPLTIAWQVNQTNYISTLSYVSGTNQKTVNLTGASQVTITDTAVNNLTLKVAPKPPTTTTPPRTCFLKGTPILMADGKTKAIEEVKVGDTLLAFDEATKSLKPDKVKQTFAHETDQYLIVNGHLNVTSNHIVYSKGKWVEIGKLDIGDSLLNAQGKPEKIASIQVVKGKAKVYNLEVNPYHTYVAGGIVAHNKIAPPPISADKSVY